MIATRFTLIAALAAVALGSAGCSNAGGLMPGTAAMQQRASAPFAEERVRIKEFADLPQYSDDYSPSAIASGPQHSLWVTDDIDQDYGENLVARIDTSGARLKTFYYQGLSTEGSSFQDIAAGPDGALWITDYYNSQIVRMTTDGTFSTFPLNTEPLGITAGPDKALWFTEYSAIGRITTKGKITIYPVGGLDDDITAGPDGALWFTELNGNAIGRITTHGKITTYTKGISSGAGPYSIAAGPDGALWFTEGTGGRIGRITTSGKVTEYSRGITPTEEPVGIAAGPDGAMWFTEYESYDSYQIRESKVGRITMAGKISEHSKGLSSTSGPGDIVAGPDGKMWFVEIYADRTGRVTL
ncbi:MAG: virginiamycin B lyase [Candidatus Cybelea sp.]|jgi:streptogramin lyase